MKIRICKTLYVLHGRHMYLHNFSDFFEVKKMKISYFFLLLKTWLHEARALFELSGDATQSFMYIP
jgi:hypothetical protein